MTNDLVLFGTTDLVVPDDVGQPVDVEPSFGGIHAIWRFPNGRGASVVNHRGSYGTELAVLRFTGEGAGDFDLDYTTPLTGDVIGHLSGPDELVDLLRQIRDLPPPEDPDTGSPDGSGQDDGIFGALDSLGRMI